MRQYPTAWSTVQNEAKTKKIQRMPIHVVFASKRLEPTSRVEKKKKKIKITQPQITNCKAEFFNYLKEEKTGKMWKTKDTKIAIVLPTFEQTASWLSFECQRT